MMKSIEYQHSLNSSIQAKEGAVIYVDLRIMCSCCSFFIIKKTNVFNVAILTEGACLFAACFDPIHPYRGEKHVDKESCMKKV